MLESQLDQSPVPLLNALQRCSQRSQAAFYTPGHKRGRGISPTLLRTLGTHVFRCDLPELPELDNLFAPEAAIQSAQSLAAAAFGAERTWFLTNGSTCGVIAAIVATCNPGDQIILPRNSHRSALSGLIACGACPIWISPDFAPDSKLIQCITPEAVETALTRYPNVKAVMAVYPTYEGICGDLAAIADRVHQHHIPLLVDEAHGPHFGFHPDLPISALAAGADLTVQSTHKVLGAMTQAAMLHVQGNRVTQQRVNQALQLFQSTSPNYLLLASLDAARQQMALQGTAILSPLIALANLARHKIQAIPNLSVLSPDQAGMMPGFMALDLTRLTVMVQRLSLDGFRVDQRLHQDFGVIAELPTLNHLSFVLSLGNTPADIDQLVGALEAIAAADQGKTGQNMTPSPLCPGGNGAERLNQPISIPHLTPREAYFSATEIVNWDQARHRISAELICPYPPGIPTLFPGEEIDPVNLEYLQQVLASGGQITGCSDPSLQTIQVVKL